MSAAAWVDLKPSPSRPVISIGITPGLSSVGFCVLSLDQRGARCIDYDILIGTRPSALKKLGHPEPTLLSSLDELVRRFNIHRMLLEVICERHNPWVVALGPAARSCEPDKFVIAARTSLKAMALIFHLPLHDVSKSSFRDTFDGEKVTTAVQRRLLAPIASSDRRVLLAAAAAFIAGTEIVNSLACSS